MCLSPQKEGSSKTTKIKIPAPASQEKNAKDSSESSDEELPASQVGLSFSLRRLQALSWAGRPLGGEDRAFPFKQHFTVSRALLLF